LSRPRALALRDGLVVALLIGLAASITLAEASLVALAAWLLWAIGTRVYRPSWPLFGPLAAFAAWSVLAALLSPAPLDSLRVMRSLLLLATLWIVLGALDDASAARRFAAGLLWAVAAVSLVAVVQVATCTPARYDANPALPPVVGSVLGKCRRAHGFFSIYMTLAGVLTVVLTAELAPLAVAGRRRAVAAAAWLTAALALALTLVRGAWLGLAAGVLVSLAGVRRRAVAVAGVVALAAAVLALPSVRQRAETLGDAGDATARERLAMIDGGLAMLRQRPIIGVGPGQVKRLYPAYAPPEAQRRHTSHLHNTPLQIAVERGVVGLALWLWIFAAFFARAWRVLRRVPADAVADRALVVGALAAVTAFLVAGLFEYNFGDTEVLLVILSVMALPFVVERDLAGRPA